MSPPELAVVVPVYNEEGMIASVLRKWYACLRDLRVDFQLHVYDDGSRDATPRILDELVGELPRLVVHHKRNSGHGPTILQGYREQADCPWIFQMDSDGEMGPEQFRVLWDRRDRYDLLAGRRVGRESGAARKLLTVACRLIVRALFGKSIKDVNVPYRLIRTEPFKNAFAKIPADTFAPNVAIAGFAGRMSLRAFEVPVPYAVRTAGESSIKGWTLLMKIGRAFGQTVRLGLSL